MKALRGLRALTTLSSKTQKPHLTSNLLYRFYAAQPQQQDHSTTTNSLEDHEDDDAVFDSSQFALPNMGTSPVPDQPTWDREYRAKADRTIFGEETQKQKSEEDERKRRAIVLAKALLEAALQKPDEEDDMPVKEEDQRSLSVGIIGAPNAGKSSLTNHVVGTKVAAVSRKTNTTTHEVLGVMTKGNTQIVEKNAVVIPFSFLAILIAMCFFDTPGLMLKSSGYPYSDMRARVESAWSSVGLYDVLIVIFDVHRHLSRSITQNGDCGQAPGHPAPSIASKVTVAKHQHIYHFTRRSLSEMSNLKKSVTVPLLLDNDGKDDLPVLPCPSTSSIGQAKPDSRVVRLIERMGAQAHPKQKRVLCMNKVDLVEKKKDLLKVADEFKDLPGYFMISGLKGSGVKDLTQFLMEQASRLGSGDGHFTGKERNCRALGNEEQSETKLKWLFLSSLLAWLGIVASAKGIRRQLITSDALETLPGSYGFKRPWDEDPFTMSEEVMKNISLEVVRERLLDHVHQEIPYGIDHRLIDWKELRDGSLRIEQHLITPKQSQRKILVGKKGSKIGRIGIEANEELRSIFKRDVHLILQVRVK
ncbi:GTP-binding protein ERG [Vitis vinifera]|uniref:GTP-binding protein ERG n=1 Tax=Vitis vinifera TaxID=29760 RepID=A0A438J0Y7_VITVI|nr:GTP-binding protein ERG [Vitis vinifera]